MTRVDYTPALRERPRCMAPVPLHLSKPPALPGLLEARIERHGTPRESAAAIDIMSQHRRPLCRQIASEF